MARNVIVDVDVGSDDALALMLLLLLEKNYDYQIKAITCSYGNTTLDCVIKNVLRILWTIGRVDVPVYGGAENSLISWANPNVKMNHFHGIDGFGDNDFPPLPKSISIERENAVIAMNRIAAENDDVYILCLAPLTNVALTLRTFPEFRRNLKGLYIMGGNTRGVGNTSSSAEFNFYSDPEAAHIVLTTSCSITLLPWETCVEPEDLTTEWRFETLGSFKSPQIELLNVVEKKLYQSGNFWNPCDAFLASAFMDDSLVEEYQWMNMIVELQGFHTRGQIVVDHLKNNKPNVKVITAFKFKQFKDLVLKMANT